MVLTVLNEINRFCIEECGAWCCKNRATVIVDGRVGKFFLKRRRCEHLKDDDTCAIYEDRPDYCRKYICKKLKKRFSIEKINKIIKYL